MIIYRRVEPWADMSTNASARMLQIWRNGMEDFKEITEALVRGSDEINRMKQEIKKVTNLIIGLIQPGDFGISSPRICSNLWYYGGTNYRGSIWYDSTTDGQWEIDLDDKVEVMFFSHNPRGFNTPPDSKLLYSSRLGVRLENVEIVYAALPAFVQAIFERVPDMQHRTEPYIRIAKRIATTGQ